MAICVFTFLSRKSDMHGAAQRVAHNETICITIYSPSSPSNMCLRYSLVLVGEPQSILLLSLTLNRPQPQLQFQRRNHDEITDEINTAHSSVPMLTHPSGEVGPSP